MAGLPKCSRCGRVRVFDPCRDCATPAELARTHGDPPRPWYPPLESTK